MVAVRTPPKLLVNSYHIPEQCEKRHSSCCRSHRADCEKIQQRLQRAAGWGDIHSDTSEANGRCWKEIEEIKMADTACKALHEELYVTAAYSSFCMQGPPIDSYLPPIVTAQHQATIVPMMQWAKECTSWRGWSSWPNRAILEHAIVGMTKGKQIKHNQLFLADNTPHVNITDVTRRHPSQL